MLNLIHSELAKMRRSPMLLISLAGSAAAPVITFLGYLVYRIDNPGDMYSIATLLDESSFYQAVLIGPALFGVLSAWLFIREFSEGTLKELMAIPLSRTALLVAKLVLLAVWVIILSIWSCLLSIVFGYIGSFEPISLLAYGFHLATFLHYGWYIFLLTLPITLVALSTRNFVPVIVLSVCLTMISVIVGNSEYRVLWPWTAVLPIVTGDYPAKFPAFVPYLVIYATAITSLCGASVLFKRMDIN